MTSRVVTSERDNTQRKRGRGLQLNHISTQKKYWILTRWAGGGGGGCARLSRPDNITSDAIHHKDVDVERTKTRASDRGL